MDITRRCDYACRIIRAAYHGDGAYRSVAEIADEEGIPYAFARSIQHELVQAGLITTVRGAHGGLKLDCDPAETTVLDVLVAVQGDVSVSTCAQNPEFCEKSACCAYSKVWRGADVLLNQSVFWLHYVVRLVRKRRRSSGCRSGSWSGQGRIGYGTVFPR